LCFLNTVKKLFTNIILYICTFILLKRIANQVVLSKQKETIKSYV
jgi:hypothetical protein